MSLAATNSSFGTRLRDTDYALELFDNWETLCYLAWIPIMFFIAKWAFQVSFWVRLGSFSMEHELVETDNKACGISFAGFLLAIGLIMYGAMVEQEKDEHAKNLYTTLAWSGIGIVYLLVSELINDLILHQRINFKKEVAEKNVAVGIVNAGLLVSCGIVIRYVIAGQVDDWGEALGSSAIFWGLAQLFFILAYLLYDLLTPYDVQDELLKGNCGVATAIALHNVAVAVIISNPIYKSESITAMCIWFVCGAVLLAIFRVLVDKTLIRDEVSKLLTDDASRDIAWTIGLVEGAVMVLVAHVCRAFLQSSECTKDGRPWKDRLKDTDFAWTMFRWYNLVFIGIIAAAIFVARFSYALPQAFRRIYVNKERLTPMEYFRFIKKDPVAFSRHMSGSFRPGDEPEPEWGPNDRRIGRTKGAKESKSKDHLSRQNTGEPSGSEEMKPQPSAVLSEEALPGGHETTAVIMDGQKPPQSPSDHKQEYSAARAVGFAGYITGIEFILTGAINTTADPSESSGEVIAYACFWILIGYGCMLTGFPIARATLWRRGADNHENLAAAFVEAAAYIASGMIVGNCLGGGTGSRSQNDFKWGEDIATAIIFFSIAQVMLIVAGRVHQAVTDYDDEKHVGGGNVAAGLHSALTWIAYGICAAAPMAKNDSVLNFFLFFILAIIVLQLIRQFVDRFILVGQLLDKEISEDHNWGAVLVEGCCAIGTAITVTTFMRQQCRELIRV